MPVWTVRLTAAATADFENILRWTVEHFGEAQARTYSETISSALTDLTGGPTVIGVKRRGEILRGICTLHVSRNHRKGRHFILFRATQKRGGEVIEVLRILHDAMEFVRHLPSADESP